MDNKYKALSYVPPKAINIKQRFGKLTLATCTSAEKTVAPRPFHPPSSSKKKLFTYVNPDNNEERISDDSVMTDDEDDDGVLSGSERNKIINNILNSDDKSEDDSIRQIQSIRVADTCGPEVSQFSEKLLLNDSDETNCNAILQTEMGKLEITLNKSTGKKSSTPLFSTTSDTIVSRLSSQMDRLGINEFKNLTDEIKIRNSLIGRQSEVFKTEIPDNPDNSLTNVSIVTISSNCDGSETEDNTENDDDSDVIVLSSDDDDEDNENRGSSESLLDRHVSSSSESCETLNTPVKKKLSDFFNNIPSPESPVRFNSAIDRSETVSATPEGHEFIPESPENLSLNEDQIPEPQPAVNTDSSVAKINSSELNATNDASHLSINISTKIQINIQISELDKTRCESSESEPKADEPQQNSSPEAEKTNSLVEEAGTSGDVPDQTSPQVNQNKFVGLNQTDVEIDEEMEGILNELYGKAWQTPQLLEKCVSTKKKLRKPPIQENIPDQSEDINFSLFGKKINDELESTRLPEKIMPKTVEKPKGSTARKKSAKKAPAKKLQDSSSDDDKPHQAPRRLDFEQVGRPKRQAALKNKLAQICDSDSSLDSDSDSCENGSDSDLNFTINVKEIPTESSDDEATKENRRDRRIGKVLDRFEYKKKPAIPSTPPLSYILPATQKSSVNSKRKLYTPQYFDVSLPEEEVTPPAERDRSAEDSLKQISEWYSLKNKKLEEVKKRDLLLTPIHAAIRKDGTAPKTSTKKQPQVKGDQNYGFLQSLDDKIPKEYCHPEAIKYRDNYAKTKYELSEKLYKLYNEEIFRFEREIDVSWNKKLLTTAGRCLTKRKFGERSCRIELSEKVLTTAGRLRCTLVHELCHAATWLFNGENGHGPQWKAWASKSMKAFPELPKIGVCHSYDIEYKYTYMCTQCDAKQQAHSKSIKLESKCCKYCRGKIEVFLNKKTKDGGIMHTPVRSATGFAKFVQDNYKTYKTDSLKHADVMKILSSKFKELGVTGP